VVPPGERPLLAKRTSVIQRPLARCPAGARTGQFARFA